MSEPTENYCDHSSCIISSFQGLINGLYYGGKIRFIHTLIMSFLFRKESASKIFMFSVRQGIRHAKILGLYVLFYKLFVCLLRKIHKKKRNLHNFIAGFTMGVIFFGLKKNSIKEQIVLYLFSRVFMGFLNYWLKKYDKNIKNQRLVNSIHWGLLIWIFQFHPDSLHDSYKNTLNFMFKESDKPVQNWRELIPLEKPVIFERIMSFWQ